jgi:hypothetical protein
MFNFSCFLVVFGDEYTEPFQNPTGKSMPTDPTEDRKSHKTCLACDGGFTQTWDTVGAGAKIPRQRELNREERIALQ